MRNHLDHLMRKCVTRLKRQGSQEVGDGLQMTGERHGQQSAKDQDEKPFNTLG